MKLKNEKYNRNINFVHEDKIRFFLYKCMLQTCCNFITLDTKRGKKYCKSHMGRDRLLLPKFKHLKI